MIQNLYFRQINWDNPEQVVSKAPALTAALVSVPLRVYTSAQIYYLLMTVLVLSPPTVSLLHTYHSYKWTLFSSGGCDALFPWTELSERLKYKLLHDELTLLLTS